jgi:hypothetical protein
MILGEECLENQPIFSFQFDIILISVAQEPPNLGLQRPESILN